MAIDETPHTHYNIRVSIRGELYSLMSLRFLPKMKWKPAALIVAAGLFVCANAWAANSAVQTYTDQAVPAAQTNASYGTPLNAGQMTLEDVLETHPLPKKPALQAPALAAGSLTSPTAAPVLSAPQSSAESDMLMQGMKSILQKSGDETPPLQAPQLPGAAAASAAPASVAPPAAAAPSSVGGVQYLPGQGPKDLATNQPLSVTPTTPVPAPAATQETAMAPAPVPAPTASAPMATEAAPASSGPCEPHTEKWTKTCVEAGYPESFTGKIEGETHVTCPANTLQDVWVSNSCAAPEEGDTASAPLSAPTSPQEAAQARAAGMSSSSAPPSPVASGMGIDGSCGPANGPAAFSKPVADLCNSGDQSPVTGDGPWRWDCHGINGGMTVSCAAALAPSAAPQPSAPVSSAATSTVASVPEGFEDGQCGPAADSGPDLQPVSGLCAHGIASRVSGNGPWTWACSGRNGGVAVACSVAKKTDGVCGSANGVGTDSMPMYELCAEGYASAITGEGPWNWTCSGLYGGSPALCSAAPKQDAVCGSASLYGHREAPRDNLCSIGQASSVNGGGPWTWSCNGANGGSPVACSSPISVNGGCGSANGVAVPSAPSDNLCSHGNPTRVTGEGPWMWNCSGTDGGETQSCVAPIGRAAAPIAAAVPSSESAPASSASTASAAAPAVPAGNEFVACGPTADFAAFSAPAKDLCAKGTPSTITGDGPWSWTCADTVGHSTTCSTLAPSGSFGEAAAPAAKPGEMPAPKAAPAAAVTTVEETPACGSANGQGTATAPSAYLCSVGKASALQGNGPWSWTCEKNKGKAQCEAPKLQDASCGSANGAMQRSLPTNGLCNAGSPTAVQGSGPWMWSCVGTGGGVSVSCSAGTQTQAKVDGACGAAAANIALSAPTANLCDGGMPSVVYGNGPWTWTCSGLNGGIASLCSAQKTRPAAPPPPGPMVNGLCGDANGVPAVMAPEDGLCSSGTVTQTSGNGPWNWNCIGANGGMTVSCTAPLQPPSPITGICGSATGVPTLTTPRSGLCAAGISSNVSGRGPWTWSCSGTNGGGAVACVAPLAGGGGTGLPSLVTPSAEAPAPQAAATSPVTSMGLTTPHLAPNTTLPPLQPGTMPSMTPSSPFPNPPEPSALPPVPVPDQPVATPAATPDLPEGTQPLTPPPIRDTIKPSPALRPPSIDASGAVIPGNKAVLPDDLSTLSFKPGAENIDNSAIPTLDKLALVLQSNSGERITLTSYAGVGPDTSPRDARRLSLTRALAIRDYLTAKGIASARINVRALGANVPSGDPDRVDIKAE